MRWKVWGVLTVTALLATSVFAQAQEGFLDVFMVKVKPEKFAEFNVLVKKIVDANRQHKGDTWLATETTYGEGYTVYFSSLRNNYAELEQGSEKFMGSLNKAYGQAGAQKLLQDFNNCIVSSRGELRRRRTDLSSNVPADAAAMNKLIGEARWIRTAIVRVRPGRAGDYEAQRREIKAAAERATPQVATFVSQSAAGQQGTVFYISSVRSSLGSFDADKPLRDIVGEEGLQKYLKTVSETVLSTETIITRIQPGLSNPAEEIVSVAPNFWKPKPVVAKPKPAAQGGKPEEGKQPEVGKKPETGKKQ
jgi:hypothetical protein